MYARSKDKVGFNIKLNKKFLGRKVLRLRPDASDKGHLRSKLSCDIANRIGLPSIQASYARLYMNGEFWGLYTLMDAIKSSFIKQNFNPSAKEITNLFQCKSNGFDFRPNSASVCVNANDDYPDMTEFEKLVEEINACETIEEVEKLMDVDVLLKYYTMEWLIGSFDHFLYNGHNLMFYKREGDGKWVMMEYDYDNTFGGGLSASYWDNKGPNQDGTGADRGEDPIKYTFADWEMNLPLVNILVHQHTDRFKEIVHQVLVSAYNPYILIPHIDEIKQFLIPYVEEDSTYLSDDSLPGRINQLGKKQSYSPLPEFEDKIENGLKVWINSKFDFVCETYGFDKEEIKREALNYVPKGYDYSSGKKNQQITTSTINEDTTVTTIITTSTVAISQTITSTITDNIVDSIPTSLSSCSSITKAYQPCGGLSFPDASPCCEEGFKCEFYSEYFAMCIPAN
ncbi:carbohydrate-binding module family 1 protein [Piromyces sp. E2]|nr:carbohydrate-binding module family 1 protein [Piromyces sp. E2]|eukprot:OUM63496.1 carbohydrate-binding module family 1 protein [Piromyces sp. E2]